MKLRWLALLAAFVPYVSAQGQIPANEKWYTIRTANFRIHFTRPLEAEARRAAVDAEQAYSNLARELVKPRGTIDLVLTDAIDASNGSASIFPSNRVVIQVRPPIDQTSLQSYRDWSKLVLQHEVAHIFHLDRTRGWWRAAQYVVGRNPFTFPNAYTPSWLSEGLAVYYESRYVDGGRLGGAYQYDIARSAARTGHVPRLDELSLARSRYPMGQAAYIYGAFVWDDISRRHGPQSVPKFVERVGGTPIPYFLDQMAKSSFGESFSHGWNRWRDSVARTTSPLTKPSDDWRVTPGAGRFISQPRWWNDSTIAYTGEDGRDQLGLYTVTLDGRVTYVDRRNSLDANVLRFDRAIVFAQLEYVDRFHLRSDLYESKNGNIRRLTYGQRLSAPDVRYDGELIAIRTIPGSTQLVRVSRDGRKISVLAGGNDDVQWATPRWSPSGTHVAVARLSQENNSIIVFDTSGAILQTIGLSRGVTRGPSWTRDGRAVLYTSDQTGVSQVYMAEFGSFAPPTVVGNANSAGLYDVDVLHGAGSSNRIAGTFLDRDGYRIGTWTPNLNRRLDSAVAGRTQGELTPGILPRQDLIKSAPENGLAGRYDTVKATRYKPWGSLIPRYWTPMFDNNTSGGWLLGALTSGTDVVERHLYTARALVNTGNGNVDLGATYEYGGLLNPLIQLSAEQGWSYTAIRSGPNVVGELSKRSQLYSLHTNFVRPKMDSYSAVIFGAELERNDYSVNPDTLFSQLPSAFRQSYQFPTLLAAVQYSNTKRPTMSISREDGISVSAVIRQRWEYGTAGSASRSGVVISSLYKSLNFPGFSHHALALRFAGGVADGRSPTDYTLGGVSGGSLEIFPGFSIGDQERTFPVRGYLPGTQRGTRAVASSIEYRAPLIVPSRGLDLLPVFLDRTSIALFADAGRAFCAGSGAPVCTQNAFNAKTLASIGAELNLDAALQYDVAYRFRFGVAKPVGQSANFYGRRSFVPYFTVGTSF